MAEFALRDDDRRIILALSPSRTYRGNTLHMIRQIQQGNLNTIAICIVQPAGFLMDFYAKNGVDPNRIFFIDAITRYVTGIVTECPANCRYIPKPNDLTAMGIAVTTTLKKFEGEKNVISLDSVNAMLIHSSSADLLKFIHFVISKIRIMNIAGILLAVGKGLDSVLLSQLTTFADELLEFPEENAG